MRLLMPRTEISEHVEALREDLGGIRDRTDEKLEAAVEERPSLRLALDFRVVLTAAAVALGLAVLARLLGLGYVLSLLVFAALFAGLWAGIPRVAAPRRPNQSG